MSEHNHDHDHDHDHNHDHAHDHEHHHHDGDTYYLDQICMVGISGAFGAICLALYISNAMTAADGQSMLRLLLGQQFHLFVLGSGIALVLVSAVRGVALWQTAGRAAHVHAHHEHDHEHEHGPDCAHEHGISAHEPKRTHAHQHGHDHHGHDHAEEDHDHGWAPWRYVLLLVPIILFLLGLPNKGPMAKAAHVQIDPTREVAAYAGLIAGAQANEGEVLSWLAAIYLTEEEGADVLFKDLENYAGRPDLRAEKQGKTVRVRGQFAPSPGSDHVFALVRFRIQCCGADAIPLPVPIVTRDSLTKTDFKLNEWVKVTGVVDFQQIGGQYKTVLRVLNLAKMERCPPDSNPYIQ